MKIVALIPSYEPDEKLIKIINELYDEKIEVVLVNDGSNRSYDIYFDQCKDKCKYISYDTNMGKGYALKTGFKYIEENYEDVVVVTMDSDGQHTVSDAKNVCAEAMKQENTIILGRRIRDEKVPFKSKWGNTLTRIAYRISSGIDIYDTQTGLRAFKSNLLPFLISLPGNRFEYEMNMLIMAPKNNIGLYEVTIKTIYENNNSGTHFNTLRDSFLIYKQIFKEWWLFLSTSVVSFILDYGLYSLVVVLSNNVILSNVSARVCSSIFNYTVNKNIVFSDKNKVSKSIFKYYLLAICILLVNTTILYLLVNVLLWNKFLAKILVEVILFFVSYLVQKRFIF